MTPDVEDENVKVPQHIENLVEQRPEDAVSDDEPIETVEDVAKDETTVSDPIIEDNNNVGDESIVEDEPIENKSGTTQAQDTNVNYEANDEIPGNDEPVIATTEETSRSDNTKSSISERMAKISMAGGFKFGPVPPIPTRTVQREAEDDAVEEVKETPQVEKEDVAPEESVENADEVKDGVTQSEEAQPEEQQEETDAERRNRIAKKLAASGALRPVLGGDPAPAVSAVHSPNEEKVHEKEVTQVEETDKYAMKDVADDIQRDSTSDNGMCCL